MKKVLLFSVLFLVSLFFCNSAKAEEAYSHTLILKPGWSVFSVPRIVESHQFSVLGTSENFNIYLLDNTKPSGWATMSELNQVEFTPLFGYFINNKTSSTQTLILNYKKNVEPNKRLFERQLSAGWNVLGIANPSYALKQKESGAIDANNQSHIFSSILNNLKIALDFKGETIDIGENWDAKTANSINELKDFRETEAYAVYLDAPALYSGYQNNDGIIFGTSSISLAKSNVINLKVKNGIDNMELGTIKITPNSIGNLQLILKYMIVPRTTFTFLLILV
jgi:hypothetical protein